MNDRQRETAKTDKIFSDYIRKRDKSCFICGVPATDCAHFVGRSHLSTRWDELNCHGLCRDCHRRDHEHPGAYEDALKDIHPDLPDLLRRKGSQIVKLTSYEIKEIGRMYKKMMDNGGKVVKASQEW